MENTSTRTNRVLLDPAEFIADARVGRGLVLGDVGWIYCRCYALELAHGEPLGVVFSRGGKDMRSKVLKIASLFLVGALACFGFTAHADNVNTSGVVCQNYNAGQALDIDYFTNGVRNINAAARPVICSVARSPLAAGAIPEFFVDGQNNTSACTNCTLTVYDFLGAFKQSQFFTECASTAGPRNWDHLVQFAANTVGTFDYVSVLCTLPGGSNGLIHGITSVQ